MRMFVWEYVDGITDRYHDGGGVVVIAKDADRARDLLMATDGVSNKNFTDEPDFSTSVGTRKEKVFIFPDAGCC